MKIVITSICFHVLPFLLASIIPLWTPTRCHLSNFTAGHIWQVKNPHDFFTGRCSQLVCLLLWSESEGFSLHPSVLFYLRIYKVFDLARVPNWKLTIVIARFFFLFGWRWCPSDQKVEFFLKKDVNLESICISLDFGWFYAYELMTASATC